MCDTNVSAWSFEDPYEVQDERQEASLCPSGAVDDEAMDEEEGEENNEEGDE